MLSRLQITLCLIKPDLSHIDYKTKALQRIIISKGFFIIKSRYLRLSIDDAKLFYYEHRERFFYNRLVYFMSSGPLWAHILAHPNAIHEWRALIGPTKVYRAVHEAPHTLRGMFGLTDTRNSVHGSDCEENARKEIAFYFPGFSEQEWRMNDELYFMTKQNIFYNHEQRIHQILVTKS